MFEREKSNRPDLKNQLCKVLFLTPKPGDIGGGDPLRQAKLETICAAGSLSSNADPAALKAVRVKFWVKTCRDAMNNFSII